MSRAVGSVSVSNGRIAWLVASGAVAAILSLPSAADAQADRPSPSVMQQRPVGPSGGGGGGGRSGGGGGSSFDLFDYRDAIANTMVVSPGPETPGAQPLNSNEVVCLAGCDRGPGSVVYRDRPTPTLAGLSAPVPAVSPTAPLPASASQAAANLSCIAGCYEPPARRTVASLRDRPSQITAPQPRVRLAARPNPAVLTDVPVTAVAATDDVEPPRLRSAFSSNNPAPAASTPAPAAKVPVAKSRYGRTLAKSKVKRGPQYGKLVTVKPPAASAAPLVEPAAPVEPKPAPAESAGNDGTSKAEPPVTKFAPNRRPERRRVEKVPPQASASNDWFNKINSERKARDAAAKSAD
jgi:hypothetical protein